jgi:hypothetical protein
MMSVKIRIRETTCGKFVATAKGYDLAAIGETAEEAAKELISYICRPQRKGKEI